MTEENIRDRCHQLLALTHTLQNRILLIATRGRITRNQKWELSRQLEDLAQQIETLDR